MYILKNIHFNIYSYYFLTLLDAALDNVNVQKVCNYIKQRSKDFQCIVISLKDMFFEHAGSLIGIYKDTNLLSSKILTLNLNLYSDKNVKEHTDVTAATTTTAASTTPISSNASNKRSSSSASSNTTNSNSSKNKKHMLYKASNIRQPAIIEEGEDDDDEDNSNVEK